MEQSNEPSHFLGHPRTSGASPAGQQRGDLTGMTGRFHTPMTPSGTSNPHTPASPHMGNISQVGVECIFIAMCHFSHLIA